MKKLLIGILALGSVSAFAQLQLDFRTEGSSFQLHFNEGYVCSSAPAFSSAPTLGYGATLGLARANAINNCIVETGNHRMHCDDLKCEAISFNSGRPIVDISVRNGQIGVRFSTGSQYTCFADAAFGSGIYIAEAPTKLEASVYAQRLCMGQTGNARMHCDVDSCEALPAYSGTVSSGDIVIGGISVNDIFGSTEDRIHKLKKEIKILKAKIASPNISRSAKTKLKKKLSRKEEKLIDLEAQL